MSNSLQPENQTNPFVPLSKLSAIPHTRVQSEVQLPLHLTNEVALNAPYVSLLLQIAGFSELQLTNSADSRRTTALPNTIGMTNTGSAFAGKTITEYIQPAEYDIQAETSRKPKQAQWPVLTAKLNTAELSRKILENGQDARMPESWATHLNSALRSVLIGAGTKNLLTIHDRSDALFSVVLYAFAVTQGLNVAMKSGLAIGLFNMLYSMTAAGTMVTVVQTSKYGVERAGEGRRFSLFYESAFDRWLALMIAAQSRQIIAPMNSTSHA